MSLQTEKPNHEVEQMSKKWLYVLAGSIVLMTVVSYIPAIQGGFIWDDDDYIINNRTLRNVDGLRRIWFEIGAVPQYYPLVHTSFWLEYHLWQLQPFGYHLINVLLHAINAILLWLVLKRLRIPGAWLAAALFAIHPVHVESVAWITERKNVLSGCFYLSAILAYLHFIRMDASPSCTSSSSDLLAPAPNVIKSHWGFYILALGLYLCALLSKTVTCTMPAAILLLIWWKRGHIDWSNVLSLTPFFFIGAVFGLTTVWVEKQHVGAQGEEWMFSFGERFLIAGRALWFYAGKLFWPYKISFIYPPWNVDTGNWWQYIFPLSAVCVFIILWLLRRQLGRAPLTAVLFFAGTLAPALGFFDIYPMRYTFVADHYQYLASIGLIALCSAVVTLFFCRSGPLQRIMGCTTCGIVLLMLGLLTWQRGHIYRDSESLWKDTLTKNPECWMAYNNLGLALGKQSRFDEGIDLFQKSLAINNNNVEAHYNLGKAYQEIGEWDKAFFSYTQVLALNPNDAKTHNNLGVMYAQKGRFTEAIVEFKQALKLNVKNGQIHSNLASAYYSLNDHRLALLHCNEAQKLGYSINPKLLEILKHYR